MKKPKRGERIVLNALRDFDQASVFITSAAANAAGWSAQVHDPRVAGVPSVLQYVWDSGTKWIWVCSTPCDVFGRLSEAASRESSAGLEAIRGCLGQSIWRAASGQTQAVASEVSWEIELGSLLASYAGTTKVWQLTNRLQEGGHFIVLYYRQSSQSNGILRPFALPVEARGRDLLPVAELREVIESISSMDRVRHPEWFRA